MIAGMSGMRGMTMSEVFEAFDLAGLEVEKCGATWRVKDWDDEKADRLDRIVHGVYGMRMVDSELARAETRTNEITREYPGGYTRTYVGPGAPWVGKMGQSDTRDMDQTVVDEGWGDVVKRADGVAKGLADKVRERLDRGNGGNGGK